MKKLLLFLVLVSITSITYSQYVAPTGNGAKSYFISADYGYGSSIWNSKMRNTRLYDRWGTVLKSGDLDFTSQTNTRYQDITVMIPAFEMMFGLGVNFEEHTMDKIDIQKSVTKIGEVGSGELIFDQKFRLDKFYALVEIPFYESEKSDIFASFQGRVGYFGYYGVDRENFFGSDESMANAYFGSIGATVSVRVFSRFYAFVHPKYEYNYFNNRSGSDSRITHHINTFAIAGGIRIDVGSK